MGRSPDTEIIKRASQEHRTLITADLDFPRLLALTNALEPSLILFRDGNWSDADIIRRMDEILRTLTDVDVSGSILSVSRADVRRRRLPIRPHS